MKKVLNNKWIIIIVVLGIGILIGRSFQPKQTENQKEESAHQHDESDGQLWTCSMHPQIQKDEPGQCPLCGMDLVPLENSINVEDALIDEVPMSESAMKLAEIQTYVVEKSVPQKETYLLGKVKADERLMYSQTVHFPGRVENLFINFTGEKVRKGQKLATIYSSELVTAQKELFEVLNDNSLSPALVDAARNKLKQWKFTDKQIAELETSGEVQLNVDILSDYTGFVMMRHVSEGDHFVEGQVLFEITDLSKVWVLFEAYENDLPWIKLGNNIEINLISIPGKTFNGKVTFIDPFINAKTRVAYVRVELSNSNGQLKPDMFANGLIKSKLKINEGVVLVPKSSVLWTGKRAVVYVKLPNRDHNSFIYREVILGEDAGDFYNITKGLEEGEEIASNGVFKIDASAQLAGKKSMMNPTGGKSQTGGHAGMDMGDGEVKEDKMDMNNEVMIDKSKVPSEFKLQLGEVVEKYLHLKNKLVEDNSNNLNQVKAIQKSLNNVDMSLVLGDAHNSWMKANTNMNKYLNSLSKSVNIDEQRNIFLSLSNSLADISQLLGVEMRDNKSLYLEFCSMADDKKGGYWLSTEKEISNPYFGSDMLGCGELIKEIN